MNTAHAADVDLARKILEGDADAFGQFMDRCHPMLVRLARSLVQGQAAADDVVQEAWVGFVEGLSRFEGRSRLTTWACSIVVHCAKKRAARDGRTVPFSAVGDVERLDGPICDPADFDANGFWRQSVSSWGAATAEELLARRESGRFLEQAIESLPERQRAVLVLRDVEGLEPEEVCNILGLSDTNQRVLLHRARARLRAALDGHLRGTA